MKEQLQKIYQKCLQELNEIGINMQDNDQIGEIEISLSNRSQKRYGICKQEEPDEQTRYIERRGRKRIIKYAKYKKHKIEISLWVMQLDESIIKNTIMHELIHCIPNCNNHGKEFKRYANYINTQLGYNIKTTGNKKDDYQKSNLEYHEEVNFKYKIQCKACGQTFFRKRINKNFTRKYRCGKCNGKLKIEEINKKLLVLNQ